MNSLSTEFIPRMNSILFYPITLGGRWGTTDEFATIPFHLDPPSAAPAEPAKSTPVHSPTLPSHLLLCLPLFLFPFTVPCRTVSAKPEDPETWPNHLSPRLLTRVRSPPHPQSNPICNTQLISGESSQRYPYANLFPLYIIKDPSGSF